MNPPQSEAPTSAFKFVGGVFESVDTRSCVPRDRGVLRTGLHHLCYTKNHVKTHLHRYKALKRVSPVETYRSPSGVLGAMPQLSVVSVLVVCAVYSIPYSMSELSLSHFFGDERYESRLTSFIPELVRSLMHRLRDEEIKYT